MKVFPEPRLLIFARESSMEESKGLVAAEKQVLFEIDNFTITTGHIMFFMLNTPTHPLQVFFCFLFKNIY